MTEGLLLVDKPAGFTSHDVVACVRRLLPRGAKVGHTGTLDPMATGLLVLLVGKATKLAARYQKLPKTYSGTMRLGVTTTTGDIEGAELSRAPVPRLSEEDLRRVLAGLTGQVELPVPAYSAVKHKGRPLYDYARRGEPAPAPLRRTEVFAWELAGWSPPEASFRVSCSSGTYVRALAEEAGRRIGCGAALSALRRERVGGFRLEDAVRLEELRASGLGGRVCAAP